MAENKRQTEKGRWQKIKEKKRKRERQMAENKR